MKLSVIIPTLNEQERLRKLLSVLADDKSIHEVIVSDGGSRDGTIKIARNFGVKIVDSSPGRGHQLASGVDNSDGEVLFFLHADSEPAAGSVSRLQQLMRERPDIGGGNFRVKYDSESIFSRFVECLCGLLRRLGLYYGDSGIFVRRTVYDSIGGFKRMAIMEDVDFVLRLERQSKTYCIRDYPLRTSTRRFQRYTPLRLMWLWSKMHLLFALGVSDQVLAVIYDAHSTESDGVGPAPETD